MLPPHRPQNSKLRIPRDVLKRASAGRIGATPLARIVFGNVRLRLKKAPAALKPSLRIIEEARG